MNISLYSAILYPYLLTGLNLHITYLLHVIIPLIAGFDQVPHHVMSALHYGSFPHS